MGRGSPAEHWAHAEYAWLQFEDGDLVVSPPYTASCRRNSKHCPSGQYSVQGMCHVCASPCALRGRIAPGAQPRRLGTFRAAIEPGVGCLQTARTHLEKALGEAEKEGCSVTDSEIGEHHYKLGRILWTMGGKAREDPKQARAHFEAASLEENDCQVLPPFATVTAAGSQPGPCCPRCGACGGSAEQEHAA